MQLWNVFSYACAPVEYIGILTGLFWMVQTPQSFRAKKLRELYLSLTEEEKSVLTDAARIYIMKGEPVSIVRGDSTNIKITYPGDIQIAEAIINMGSGQ